MTNTAYNPGLDPLVKKEGNDKNSIIGTTGEI